MKGWTLEFLKSAEEDLEAIDRPIRRRVIERLDWFVENFDDVTPLLLGGVWRGFFKLRIGDWRVIYNIEYKKKGIFVHYIDHRDKIYKRSK